MDKILSESQVGFDELKKALMHDGFNKLMSRQMNNGKFLNKIMKGMMGIRSKKLMMKYFHIMMQAVDDPHSFACWKYDE